ncbi:MAG: polyvinylalcohol dehydrogenase [Verrucomicrobia bacterium]|nr:polyvinylalcohol dehydrogenase [Verrucomicrobiota bacterium]
MLALGFTAATIAAAADWAQWRGPNRDGLCAETGLLKSWPAGGPPLAWEVNDLGGGYATVSVVGDRIYTAGEQGEGNSVIALERATGRVVWSTKLGKAGAPGWGGFGGPRCTPTVAGDLVYAIGQYGELACYEAASGKEVWRKHFVTDFGGRLPEWGFSESPLVDGDRLLCTPGGSDGIVVALNKRTGALLWRSQGFTDPVQYSSLVPVEIDGVRQYLQLTMASVGGVAAADGKLLWRAERKGSVAVIPTPIYHDRHVYVSSGYGVGCNLFKVGRASADFAVEQVYANKTIKNHHGGVTLLGDHLYGYSDGDGWTCQEFKTGNLVWQEKDKLRKGALAYADGHFYLREEEKSGSKVALIEATPAGYREKGRFEQPDQSGKNTWAHPVIAGGKLYLRDQDVLLCYDVKAK